MKGSQDDVGTSSLVTDGKSMRGTFCPDIWTSGNQRQRAKFNPHNLEWLSIPESRGTYFHNAAYENVVALVIDPVLQHHFVHHGDKYLVLKISRERRNVNKTTHAWCGWPNYSFFFGHKVNSEGGGACGTNMEPPWVTDQKLFLWVCCESRLEGGLAVLRLDLRTIKRVERLVSPGYMCPHPL